MKLRPAWLAILTGLGLLASSAGLAATQAPASQKKEQTGKKQAAPGASLSGCIDQQEGHYVLVDDRKILRAEHRGPGDECEQREDCEGPESHQYHPSARSIKCVAI